MQGMGKPRRRRKSCRSCGNSFRGYSYQHICYGCYKKGEEVLTPKEKLAEVKKSAATRGKRFTLEIEDILKVWKQPCYYCGEPIKTAGLDRYDNRRGYEPDNIVPCCYNCNRMKATMHGDDFLDLLAKIFYKHYELKKTA